MPDRLPLICQFLDNDVVGAALVDDDGDWQYISPAFLALTGYTDEELRRRTLEDVIHPQVLASLRARHLDVRREIAGVAQDRHRYMRKDGQSQTGRISLSKLANYSRPSQGFHLLLILPDNVAVTPATSVFGESRSAPIMQWQSNLSLFDAVMSNTPDLIFAKDMNGRYLLANTSVEKIMGRPAIEIMGCLDMEIFPSEVAQPLIENDRHVLKTGAPYTVEESTLVNGILRTYSSTKAPYRNEQGEVIGVVGVSRDITDVKLAEAKLREGEMRWQFALDGSGDGIWDWDTRTQHVYYSRQWKAMLGYSENEIGTAVTEWSDRVHPDDLPRCWDIVNEHFRGETPDFTLEHRMKAKDGTWRWIYDRGKVVERAEDGSPLRVIGTHTNITERKQSEADIFALSQRLQLAISAFGAGVFTFDLDTHRFLWDARMYEIYGVLSEEFDGSQEHWLSYLHPDDATKALRQYKEGLRKSVVIHLDFRIKHGLTHATRHVRCLVRVIRDEGGKAIQYVGMNWDVTGSVEQAESLYEEKERLRVTLHSIGDSVITTDAHSAITYMNPVAEKMTGWPSAEALGRPIAQVFQLLDDTGAAVFDPVGTCLSRMEPVHLDEDVTLLTRDGERRHVRDSAAPVRAPSGEIMGAVLVFQDVTKARTLQQALEHSASHDSLTGLPNRSAFEGALRNAIETARGEGRIHTMCFIDLDRFKLVNDGAGHSAGDGLLREVANLLRRSRRSHDLAARLGGDEFALLLPDCAVEDGYRIAKQLCQDVDALRFTWDNKAYYIGASIGLTEIAAHAPRLDEVISQADLACYAAKAAGRSRVSIYEGSGESAQHHHREIQVAADIRNAIESNRFSLFAQEIRSTRDGTLGPRHFEILLRMLDDQGNFVEPGIFIPAAEAYDLMGNIDRWVVRTALLDYGTRLRDAGDISIAINLSGNSLNDPFLWPFVRDALLASPLPASHVQFEITETAVVHNMSAAAQFVARAREMGCRVSLDDFGKGLSSFTYLSQFPVDTIKIDGGFVRRMAYSKLDRTIVESINTVGHCLGSTTVAEHVEDEETLELVRDLGIDFAQGYAISRPMRLDEILA